MGSVGIVKPRSVGVTLTGAAKLTGMLLMVRSPAARLTVTGALGARSGPRSVTWRFAIGALTARVAPLIVWVPIGSVGIVKPCAVGVTLTGAAKLTGMLLKARSPAARLTVTGALGARSGPRSVARGVGIGALTATGA